MTGKKPRATLHALRENLMPEKTLLIYDGDCPFCAKFAQLVRFKKAAGAVEMVNAREHPELVKDFAAKGIDLDKGMALQIGDDIYHGDAALNRIALMSTKSDLFNAFNAAVFRSKLLSKIVYPVMKAGRKAALLLRGKKSIGADEP